MIRWKIAFVALLGSIGLASLLSGQTPRAAQVVAVRAGRLFDSKSGQMVANQVIVIQGERIFQLERALFEAAQAMALADGEPVSAEMVTVGKTEYELVVVGM